MRGIVFILLLGSMNLHCKFFESGFSPDHKKIANIDINRAIQKHLSLAETLTDDNEKAHEYCSASVLLLKKGDTKQAISVARKGRRLNPANPVCLAYMAECYIEQGRLDEAESMIFESLLSDPNYARAKYLSGLIQFQKKNWKGAVESFQSVLQLDPNHFDAQNNLASIYLKTNKPQEAYIHIQNAIEIRPNFAMVYRNAGIIAEKKGEPMLAKDYYNKYLELNPKASDKEVVIRWIGALK